MRHPTGPAGPARIGPTSAPEHLGLTTLEQVLQIGVDGVPQLIFESAQPVVQARGKPSYTDLLIRGTSTAIAIEAKYAELRYQTVQEWLAISPEGNRSKVLAAG